MTLQDLKEELNGFDYVIKYPILETFATLSKREGGKKVKATADGPKNPQSYRMNQAEAPRGFGGKGVTARHVDIGGSHVMLHKQPQEERLSAFDNVNLDQSKNKNLFDEGKQQEEQELRI